MSRGNYSNISTFNYQKAPQPIISHGNSATLLDKKQANGWTVKMLHSQCCIGLKGSNDAFELAWDTYVDRYFVPKEGTEAQIYPAGYPACDAENKSYVCELQWDNSQNAIRKCEKCT